MKYVKKKTPKKSIARKFFYMVFFLIMIYIFGYCVSFFTQKKINSTLIEYANSDNPQMFSGVIVRNEKIYTSQKSGAISLNLHNFDIAKKNCVVCTIKDKESVEKLEDDLSKINNDILDMQKNRIDISLFQNDIKNANNQIEKIVDENIYVCSQNNFDKINSFADAIKKNLDLRNQILLTENRGDVKEMDEKKSQIEQKIKKNIESISATQTGIVSYFIDGLEKTYTLNKLNNLTSQQTNIKSQSIETIDNSYVEASQPIFKIIESNEWYIVSYVKNKDIENIKENDSKTIFIENENNFTPIDVYIEKIIAKNKTESCLVMKCTKFVQDYLQNRNIKFKLDDTKLQGFKIPVCSIDKKNLFKIPVQFVLKDNNEHTVTKKNNEKVKVKIYDSDENYYYVESNGLKSKDIIISSDESYEISQMKKIYGIYIANTGIAEFKKINYADEILENGFIIIDPKLNPSIKISDRIITNVKDVNDEQKIIES